MQVGLRVGSGAALRTGPQPSGAAPLLMSSMRPFLAQAIINPKRGTGDPFQPQTPGPPRSCGSPGAGGKSCLSLDVRLLVLLVTLAGALILLLLYRLLQMRHRLRLAMARHALEYHSFYHTATYTLKHPTSPEELPTKNGTHPSVEPIRTVSAVTPLPPTAAAAAAAAEPSPPLPPPPAPPPFLPLPLPLPLPVVHTTPPSPHLSWGACSDVDVYSRIGAFRPSRLSSLSSQSKVILFEHSSL